MILQRVAIVNYRSITRADLKLGEITVLIGPTDSGKCLGRDTEVMMADGNIKWVQDIVVGDRIAGPAGSRLVLDTTRGRGPLYRIVPRKGTPWVCNDRHMLTLSRRGQDPLDMEVRDYLESTREFKNLHRMFRVPKPEMSGGIRRMERFGFDIVPIGEGDYYGFSLDGDGRFLLGDYTVTHNSNATRALRDWASNAIGQDFTTMGCQKTMVVVVMHERFRVAFVKDKYGKGSRTKFVTHDAETGEKLCYEKVGRTVPREIRDLTRFFPLEVDDISFLIQFAMQAESWFLLGGAWTPGKVSKIIGKISGIDALLLGNQDLVNARVANERELKRVHNDQREAERTIGSLAWAREARKLVDEAKDVLDEIQGAKASIASSRSWGRKLKESRDRLKQVNAFLEVARQVVELVDEIDIETKTETLRIVEREQIKLTKLEGRMTKIQASRAKLQGLLKASAEELRELAGDQDLECPLCGQPAHADCRHELAHQAIEAEQ